MTENVDVPHPSDAFTVRRRTLLLGATALGIAGAATGAPTAQAAPGAPVLETFDSMPVGAPPAGATVSGTNALVEAAPFGGAGNRAVHLTDTSTTTQTVLTFPAPAAAPAMSFSFDLSFTDLFQNVFVAIQGTGANPALGLWRFLIGPAYGKNPDGLIQVYDGTAWKRLGVVQDLTLRGNVTRIRIDASTTAAVVRIGEYAFRTTVRASAASAITGLQLASSSAAATGTNVWVDNVGRASLVPGDVTLEDGLVATDIITRYPYGTSTGWTQVATLPVRPNRMRDLEVRVHVANAWHDARLSSLGGEGVGVYLKLDDPHIGEHPVTVTVYDRATGTVLSAQSRAHSVGTITPTVIATEQAPQQIRFPDAVRLADGTFVLAYYHGSAHAGVNGDIRVIRSTDQGSTWSAPVTVLSTPEDDRDPKLAVLRDGTVLLTTFRTGFATSKGQNLGVFVQRSTDGGLTFGEPVKIDGAQPGAWEHGPALELPNGDILQPLYGYGARVARSTDGGRTFPAANEVLVVPETPSRAYQEPNLVRLPSGEIIMSIRTSDRTWGQETYMTLSRSHDDGRTWSPLEQTDMPTSSHHTLLARDGSVLVAWGNQWQDARPTYVTHITDPSGPWVGYTHVPLYSSTWHDQANPTTVQLDDGSFLTFGYDVVARTLVQIHHRG